MGANDTQVGGEHYKAQQIQPWDFIVANGLGFLEGNIVKYVARWQAKGGVQDLEKAQHYLAKLIEVAKEKAVPPNLCDTCFQLAAGTCPFAGNLIARPTSRCPAYAKILLPAPSAGMPLKPRASAPNGPSPHVDEPSEGQP